MQPLFWISVLLAGYVYAGYPLLVWLLGRVAGRGVNKDDTRPKVTVLTAAHNEAEHIEATVRNKLEQDYPPELLEVIVISDGSTDGTDHIVQCLGDRVRLFRQEPRAGKTAALNLAVRHAEGDILVFADANSMYGLDAVAKLVANFADPSVGYVTGKMVYVNSDGSLVGDGCSAYMRYENWLRAAESRLASVVGVDGGVDAVRKSLYQPMRPDQQPDFVLPLVVVQKGYRVVYEPEAVLCEPVLSSDEDEYRMRVRVSLRALWTLWDMKHLMSPVRHGMFAFQVLSHKLLRYTAFVPLLLAYVTSLSLISVGTVYALAASVQTGVYLLAAAGWAVRGRAGGSLLGFPYYFLLLNVASCHAVVRFFGGYRQAIWSPRTG